MIKYFDSHAHYDDSQFDKDRDDVLKSLPSNFVEYIINAGTDYESSSFSVNLSDTYSHVFAAVGVHPHDAAKKDSLDHIKSLAVNKKVVAIGEIGLDYHYDFSPRDLQKEYFGNQLLLANEVALPVIVHDREAHKDTLDILKSIHVAKNGVIHCYSGSLEMAKDLLNMGYYLGFGGSITFPNAKTNIEVLKYVPLDRILIETDCPYLAPIPVRGSRNTSIYLKYVVEKIAEERKMSCEEIAEITMSNAKKLFNIK